MQTCAPASCRAHRASKPRNQKLPSSLLESPLSSNVDGDEIPQTVEVVVPAETVVVSHPRTSESSVVKDDLGRLAQIAELDGDSGHALIAVPNEGVDQFFRWIDFQKLAGDRQLP